MKKNYRKLILVLAIIALCVSAISISDVYAKYVASANGAVDISIARWDIKLNTLAIKNGTDISAELTPVFDTNANLAANKLAPGATGYFDLALDYIDKEIPPTASIEGVDLVTEGVITINRVLDYAKDMLQGKNHSYFDWSYKRDGASQIAKLLFEEATDINFFVGCAINNAHQSDDVHLSFSLKMQLIDELAKMLKLMGKNIKVSYF